MTKQTSCLHQLVCYQYLQYLGQKKLSKLHIKQINIIHFTLPLFKEKNVILNKALMNNYIHNNNVKSNQINKQQKHKLDINNTVASKP